MPIRRPDAPTIYRLSLLGLPSTDQPWGWQLDGHHLIVNCFVLGDQVVMTPLFMGSEPVSFPDGTRVFGAEEQQGLALMRALTDAQRGRVILSPTLPGEAFTAAFRDNFEVAAWAPCGAGRKLRRSDHSRPPAHPGPGSVRGEEESRLERVETRRVKRREMSQTLSGGAPRIRRDPG